MLKFLIIIFLIQNSFAKERMPIFFTNSLNNTAGTIKYWPRKIELTYEHNNSSRLATLVLTDTVANVSCTIEAKDYESSFAVENLYHEMVQINDQVRTINCLSVLNIVNATVTLDQSDNAITSKVKLSVEP